ncbi:MAG: hypothetical protein ABJB76_10370 [Candidatus Nitrosocosmicus sp.]
MNKKRKNIETNSNNTNNTNNKEENNNTSYFARSRKKRNQYMKIIIPAIIGVIAISIVLAIAFPGNNASAKFGMIGSAHEHAALIVDLNGTNINFAQPKYMLRSNYIHMENHNGTLDGTTLHKHATKVPIGEFLKSIRMDISNGCFITDENKHFCENKNLKLRYYINGNETKDIMNYVLKDNDRILILYGNQSSTEINHKIQELNNITINK